MMQNINLYNTNDVSEKFIFTITHMLKLGRAVLVILLLISCYSAGWYAIVKFKVAQLKKQQTITLQSIEQSISAMPSKNEQENLAKKVAELEEIKKDKQKVYITLRGLQQREKQEFSNYLTVLATHEVPNIWLTAIKITANGKFITLDGKTTDSDNVPMFIKKIADSGAFTGKTFSSFGLIADETDKRIMNFYIKSD